MNVYNSLLITITITITIIIIDYKYFTSIVDVESQPVSHMLYSASHSPFPSDYL